MWYSNQSGDLFNLAHAWKVYRDGPNLCVLRNGTEEVSVIDEFESAEEADEVIQAIGSDLDPWDR